MEPELWQRVEQLYHEALAVDESQRQAFLEKACAGDEFLKEEVRALLAQSTGGSFLEAPAEEVAANAMAMSAAAGGAAPGRADTVGIVSMPAAIGRYRLVRLLGEGGMGTVYEAEQEQPRRTVALKVIRPGYTTPETLRRFLHESQALGRLQHPGIAQIYEASTADTGSGPQPYFAMELIRGSPLKEYVDARQLNVRERLTLLAKICDAVDHAHHRGVIHRDLKPGNILVDETGQPKILDFGVARVTESDVQLTRQTDVGQLVGTLAYMSPEQVEGDPQALDSRSDVYGLGVILYELLAGRLPYDVNRKPLHEAVGIIREDDPTPLSSIHRSYRGDIETIAAKAMEKDKTRRYASAADLAADIRRYLADEPILARPASAGYQVRKFARRHKALVAGTAAVFVALAVGMVASTVALARARAEKRRADAEAATAKAVKDFLQKDLLAQAGASAQSGPATKPDPDLKVRTALDRAAARISGKFDRQPEVEAAIRETIGQTYADLGLYPEAGRQLQRALDLYRRVLGGENPKTLDTMSRLGGNAYRQGRYADAERLLSGALEVQRRVRGPEHLDTLGSMGDLASVYYLEGKHMQAQVLYSQAYEISKRVLGAEHSETLSLLQGVATAYGAQEKYAQAQERFSQALEISRRVLGPEHPDTLSAMLGLATAYCGLGKFPQAERLYSQTLEIQRRVLGPENDVTLMTMGGLADAYFGQGNYRQAETLYTQALESSRRVMGVAHFETLDKMRNLADVYGAEGNYARAEALFSKTLEIERRALGPEHPMTLDTLARFAFMRQRQGKYGLAEAYGAQALAGRRHALGPEESDTMVSVADVALAYQSQGKFAASEPLAREAMKFFQNKQPDEWQRFRAESLLGASLAGQKKYAEAEPLLVEGYRGMVAREERIAMPDRYHVERAREWIAQLNRALGRPADSESKKN